MCILVETSNAYCEREPTGRFMVYLSN